MKNRRDLFAGVFVGLTALGSLVGGVQADDCLQMTVSTLYAGWDARWDIDGATPNTTVAVVWGLAEGETVLGDVAGYCATFGIAGVDAGRVVGTAVADGNGHAAVSMAAIPRTALRKRVYTQAAERGSCPDECVSNIDSQIVRRY